MNHETIGYAIFTAVIGISIVFSFLAFLCLFMVFLKKFIDRPGKETKGVTVAKEAAASTAISASSVDDNTWVIAAVAAYLEEESAPVSAMAWIPSVSEKQEPWVTVPRIQKRLARA